MMNLGLSLSLTRARGAGAAAFTPADLFAAGENGSWYDPSDLSTLWQDTGGTVAVTADGDSVARMDDKSGNGNHATQGTAANRPVYKTDGTHHWLLADGVDDRLVTASIPITDASGHHSSAAAARLTSISGTQRILDADEKPPRVSQLIRSNAGTIESIAFNDAGSAFTDSSGEAHTTSEDFVPSEITGSGAVEAFKDGIGNGSTATSGTLISSNVVTALLANAGGVTADPMTGRFYGAIINGKEWTASEHSDVRDYLNGKMP